MWFTPEQRRVVEEAARKKSASPNPSSLLLGTGAGSVEGGYGGFKQPKSPYETSPESIREEQLKDPGRVSEEDYRKVYQSGIQRRTDEAIRNAAMRRGMGRSGYAQAAVNRAREQGTEEMGAASTKAMLAAAEERTRRYALGTQMTKDREDREQAARIAEDERRRLAAQEAEERDSFLSSLVEAVHGPFL